MSDYYLLTFNQDWADEHNVPALECMTEEQYQEWLKKPSGKLNKKYDEQFAKWKEHDDKQNAFYTELQNRGLYNKRMDNYTQEETTWYHKNKIEYRSSWSHPKRVKSFLSAHLGNGGDNFNEGYEHLYLFQEYVDNGVVSVMEVDKSFFETFHKARLSSLSLCNVFGELYDYDEEDDE